MGELSIASLLRQLPYFTTVTEEHLHTLAQNAIHHSYSSGQIIFQEGDPSSGLLIVVEGHVKAFKLSPDGQEYILSLFGPGDIFNDLAALDNLPNVASTMAVTDVKVWMIPPQDFASALQADHELCLAVLSGLARRTRNLVSRLSDLALRPVTTRVARFLLEQIKDPSLAHPTVTRTLIANYLATTPESISRSLRALEAAGAIQFDRHRIIIINQEELHQQAQLSPN